MSKNKRKVVIISTFLLLIIIICVIFKNNIMKIIYPETYKDIINEYAEKYEVDTYLIFALIKAESNFDENAVSNQSAIGLMQIVKETAIEVVETNEMEIDTNNIEEELLDAEKNINIGTKYLSTLLERYNNIEVALAAYNAGIGNVDSWIDDGIINSDGTDIENIPYKETNNYVRKILRDYKIYKKLYENG